MAKYKKEEVREEHWRNLADSWTPRSDWTIQSEAPSGVECKTCWDFHKCAECLGLYPSMCPLCTDTDHEGKCFCQSET